MTEIFSINLPINIRALFMLYQHSLKYILLYKYILLVRVIREKNRLRGETNIPSRFRGEGRLTVSETRIFRK